MSTFNTLNKTEARAACKKAGISYTNMTVADMRAALEAASQAHRPSAPAVVGGTEEPVEAAEEVSEQRTDDAPAPYTAPEGSNSPATEQGKAVNAAVAEALKPKPVKVAAPKNQKNGISRPGSAESKTGMVWAACDALKAEGKELTFEALRAMLEAEVADATIRTQRQRWKQFNA